MCYLRVFFLWATQHCSEIVHGVAAGDSEKHSWHLPALKLYSQEKFAGDSGADGRQIHLEPALKSLSVSLRWCDAETCPNLSQQGTS